MASSDSEAGSAKGASSGDDQKISPVKSTGSGKRVIASDDDSSGDAPVSERMCDSVVDNNLCSMPTRRRRLANKQAVTTTDMIVAPLWLLCTILLVSS